MAKKSHKVLLIIGTVFLLIGEIVFVFVVLPIGCTAVFACIDIALFDPYYDEVDDSLYSSGRDFSVVEYSNKIQIHKSFDEYDEVILCNNKEQGSNDDFFYDGYTILTGDITKFAWNDYKLYILLDGIFYEFDINSFEPPVFDDDGT